jgi:hypothetical protein
MSVCVCFVCAVLCAGSGFLRRADPPSKEFYDCVKDQGTEKAAKV